jgi:hypothetical protein
MPVVTSVAIAQAAMARPAIVIVALAGGSTIEASPKMPVGTKVTTLAIPSRDSHDERHCENARQARSGRPRCSVDDRSPAVISASANPKLTMRNVRSAGRCPTVANVPSITSSP